jgi:hypothetical protein
MQRRCSGGFGVRDEQLHHGVRGYLSRDCVTSTVLKICTILTSRNDMQDDIGMGKHHPPARLLAYCSVPFPSPSNRLSRSEPIPIPANSRQH